MDKITLDLLLELQQLIKESLEVPKLCAVKQERMAELMQIEVDSFGWDFFVENYL